MLFDVEYLEEKYAYIQITFVPYYNSFGKKIMREQYP